MGLFDFLKPRILKRNEIRRINYISSHRFKGFTQLFIKAKYDVYKNGQKQLLKKYANLKKGTTLSELPVAFILNDNEKNSKFIELEVDGILQGIVWEDSKFYDDILDGNVEKVTIFPEDGELRFFIKLK